MARIPSPQAHLLASPEIVQQTEDWMRMVAGRLQAYFEPLGIQHDQRSDCIQQEK